METISFLEPIKETSAKTKERYNKVLEAFHSVNKQIDQHDEQDGIMSKEHSSVN